MTERTEITIQEYNMMRAMERQREALNQHSSAFYSFLYIQQKKQDYMGVRKIVVIEPDGIKTCDLKFMYGASDYSEYDRTNRNTNKHQNQRT